MARKYATATIGGTTITKWEYGTVRKSINDVRNDFTIILNNDDGEFADTFAINDDVQIKLDGSNPPSAVIFRGIVEQMEFNSQPGNRQILTINGRDYLSRLGDVNVNRVFINSEISTIITSIIGDELGAQFTTTNVDVTAVTLDRIEYKQKPVLFIFEELARVAKFKFWIDESLNFFFKSSGSISSGVTLDNTNVLEIRSNLDRDNMYNDVYVYGGRYLTKWQETFTPNGGSLFSVTYPIHSTDVEVNGTKQFGYPLNQSTVEPGSADYLVDFIGTGGSAGQVIFVAASVPGSNVGSVVINYDRMQPIVKRSIDRDSIDVYRRRELIIDAREISDPRTCKQITKSLIKTFSLPDHKFTALLDGLPDINLGETVIIDFPEQNINDVVFLIESITYEISEVNLNNDNIMTVGGDDNW